MLSRLLSRPPVKTPVRIVHLDPFTVHIKPHARARSLTLRYQNTKGHFVLTVPKRISQKAAMEFLHSHMTWMQTQAKISEQIAPEQKPGHILIEDHWRRIEHKNGTGVHIELLPDTLLITCRPERMQRAITRFIRQHALDTVTHMARKKASRIGKTIDSISVRDTTSRWGSCSHDGRLSFSWRLIMAPYDVIDYVVAHEVAHLQHFDHSKDFWALCRDLSHNYTSGKHWLKLNGQSLHHLEINLPDNPQA